MSNLLHCWDRPLGSPIIHARKKWPPQSGDGNKASLLKCLISLLTICVIRWQCGSQHTPCRFLKMPTAVSTLKVQTHSLQVFPGLSNSRTYFLNAVSHLHIIVKSAGTKQGHPPHSSICFTTKLHLLHPHKSIQITRPQWLFYKSIWDQI